jgi:hypothetical protein
MAASLRTCVHESGHVVACITYGVEIISVTVEDRPHLHRGHYHPHASDLGLEAICVLCLSGIAAEEYFFGVPIPDPAAIQQDLRMARDACSRAIADPWRAAVELARCRVAAERLVRSEFARQRITSIARLLLARGTLRGEEIFSVGL